MCVWVYVGNCVCERVCMCVHVCVWVCADVDISKRAHVAASRI